LLTLNNTKSTLAPVAFDSTFFQLLISGIEDHAIFMIDGTGLVLNWNPGAASIIGYQAEEIIGKHIAIFYTANDQQQNTPGENLDEALKNKTYKTEAWHVKKDDSLFWASINITTFNNDDGQPAGFVVITHDISGRKLQEDQKTSINKAHTAKHLSNERRFRKLIENSYDGISLFDKNLNVFYRSRSAQRINGWNNAERFIQEIDSLVHPDDLDMVKTVFAKVIAKPNRPLIVTHRSKHKLGYYIWVECLLTNKFNDVDINAIVCNFRDVTERIKTEIQLRDKNKQIENILQSITDGFIALDKNFCYTFANNKIGEMLARSPGSLIGKKVWDVFPDAVNSATYNAMYKAVKEQHYVCNEDYYPPLNLWQENHIYPHPDGLSVFIRDITERKKAEMALLQSESNLRSIFENTDRAITLFDMAGNICSFNDNANTLALNYFNTPLKIGLTAFDFSAKKRRPQITAILQQIKHQSPICYEISYPLPDDTVQWYDVRWDSVINHENAATGIILTLKDISEKKQYELERDRVTTDLVQRNKDLEQFTYIISHNLRAPVANIKGLAGIVYDMLTNEGNEGQQVIEALSKSVNNLDIVIMDLNQILEVSSASNDKLVKVSLPMLVEDIKSGARALMVTNNVQIHYDFDSITEITIIKSYLYSIFQNLITNSIKYRKPEVDPVIYISGTINQNTITISFKDNGKGIDLDSNGQKLFGLYKRFDYTVEGKGMGLYMVKMQIERLGGTICVKSRLNEGTLFTLELPLNLPGARS
jgi:PAS domain S-box-containing protein